MTAALRRACRICGTPAPLSSTGRCAHCRRAHISDAVASAVVHPTSRYADDEAAQRFVAEHPDGSDRESIARLMGITRERVRQVEVAALSAFAARLRLVGISEVDVIDWLSRHRGAHPLDGEAQNCEPHLAGHSRSPESRAMPDEAEPWSELGQRVERAITALEVEAEIVDGAARAAGGAA